MNAIFNELDHRLSVVKRWGLLHTLQTQSVAEHAFNVARIAERLAVNWFGIQHDSPAMGRILHYAHHHDDFEALTLDLPTMTKPYFDEKGFEKDHADLIKLPEVAWEYKQVVKLADLLEGWHFLCIEKQLGNNYADNHLDHEIPRIMKWFELTFRDKDGFPIEWYNRRRDDLRKLLGDMRSEKSTRFSRRGA